MLRCSRQNPVLTPDGIVFDILNIVPYVRKNKKVCNSRCGRSRCYTHHADVQPHRLRRSPGFCLTPPRAQNPVTGNPLKTKDLVRVRCETRRCTRKNTGVVAGVAVPHTRSVRHSPACVIAQLHFHKNKDGVYHDPVTYKVFGPHTHIAAVKTSGNVYAYATVKQLNFDTGNLKVRGGVARTRVCTRTVLTRACVALLLRPFPRSRTC